MKKLLSICLVLVLILLNVSSVADTVFQENFTIRNGIHSGMTKAEVQAAESASVDAEGQMFTMLHSDEKHDSYLYYKDINLAGYKGTVLAYGFDADGKLKDVTYMLDNAGLDGYSDMLSKLSEKYGKPILDTSIFPTESSWMLMAESEVSKNSIYNFSGWILQYDDCYISLELVAHKCVLSSSTYYFTSIGYGIVTYDEYNAMLEKIQQFTQSVEDSVNNDL